MQINNLIVEVTRRCNLSCSHCLRGDAQNVNILKEHIDALLSQCDFISNLCFTGGEPSLHTEAITYFLNKAKSFDVGIGSFYIATNAVDVGEEFVITCLKLYAYCEDKDMCSIAISNDYYHAVENSYNTELLDGLSFVSRRSSKESEEYDYLLAEGRAIDEPNAQPNTEPDINTKEDFDDAEIYLNCYGDIINGCNWSYANQSKNILCRVENLTSYYNTL